MSAGRIQFARSAAATDEHDRALAALKAFQRAHRDNKFCADCRSIAPTYVCVPLGIFICTTCAGVHREFNHKVKSLSVSTWSLSEVANICTKGNKNAEDTYMANYKNDIPLPAHGDSRRLRQWVKFKYVDLRWATPEAIAATANSPLPSNRALSNATTADGNGRGVNKPAGVAAGIIAGSANAEASAIPAKKTVEPAVNQAPVIDLLGLSDPDFLVGSSGSKYDDVFAEDPFASFNGESIIPAVTAAATDLWDPFVSVPSAPASSSSAKQLDLFDDTSPTIAKTNPPAATAVASSAAPAICGAALFDFSPPQTAAVSLNDPFAALLGPPIPSSAPAMSVAPVSTLSALPTAAAAPSAPAVPSEPTKSERNTNGDASLLDLQATDPLTTSAHLSPSLSVTAVPGIAQLDLFDEGPAPGDRAATAAKTAEDTTSWFASNPFATRAAMEGLRQAAGASTEQQEESATWADLVAVPPVFSSVGGDTTPLNDFPKAFV